MILNLRATLREPTLWRWTARLSWLAVALLATTILHAVLPHLLYDTYTSRSAQEAQDAVVRLIPFESYVRLLVGLKLLSTAIFVGVAVLIAWRKWSDPAALIISTLLLLMGIFQIGNNLTAVRFPQWVVAAAPWLPYLAPPLVMSSLVLIFFLFPSGRFVPGWTGWVAGGVVAIIFGFWSPLAQQWHRRLGMSDSEIPWITMILAMLAALILALGSQIYRYRRLATPVERQQVKWVLFGLGLVLLVALLQLVAGPLWPSSSVQYAVGDVLWLLVMPLIPLTMAFSIFRYRLWEIDLLINRTLVYGLLTALVFVFYIAIVGSLSLLFQIEGNPLLSALATGLIAILFQSLRQWLQQAVNRLMYGERDDPVAVLAALGKRLEATTTPEMILSTLVETLCHALKLPYAAIVLKQGDELRVAANHGEPAGATETIPLLYQGEMVGELRTAPRGPGETLSRADHRLIGEIAHHAGAAVHAARLTADLQQSRERLVTAREEERRRLRRDLHDGLGPQLATLSLQVDAARNLLQSEPAASNELLGDVKAGMQAAIADIRRLVYDLRPPALDQLGLVSALREYTAACAGTQGLRFQVEAPEHLPPLPAAVEVAAYRIVLEAITNVLRHARARQCMVRLQLDDGRWAMDDSDPSSIAHRPSSLILAISDDGVGLPAQHQAGVGLASMRERAEELGGSCRIESAAGNGTEVLAVLPLNFTNP